MFAFLLIVQILIAGSLVLVILMQRSEGGGLGVGGSSSGFMTARGAADFLTRSTSILGGAFIVLSIVMAAIAGATRQAPTIDTSLANTAAPLTQPQQQPAQGTPGNQAAPTGQGPVPGQTAPTNSSAPANQAAPAVPLAQ
jgi:preprotein translocase subunit SecG